MSQSLGDTDLDALAAEYVLGTLGSDERVHAQALLVIDDGFATKVQMWERRLGELHLMVETVEPDAQIWERIKNKFSSIAQNPVAGAGELEPTAETKVSADDTGVPDAAASVDATTAVRPGDDVAAPALAPADTPAGPDGDAAATTVSLEATPNARLSGAAPAARAVTPIAAAEVAAALHKPALVTTAAAPFPSAPRAPITGVDRDSAVRRSRGRWRAFATFMTLIVIAVGGLVAAWRFGPEYVPPILQPVEALRAVGIMIDTGGDLPPPPPPRRPPAPPESQFDE